MMGMPALGIDTKDDEVAVTLLRVLTALVKLGTVG